MYFHGVVVAAGAGKASERRDCRARRRYLDIDRDTCPVQSGPGAGVPVLVLHRLGRRAIDGRAERNLRMAGGQFDLDASAGGGLKNLIVPAMPSGRADPEPVDCETERLAQGRQVDLQAVVPLQGTSCAEAQPRRLAADAVDLADKCAAVPDGVPVGNLLVLVRLHEQASPGAAEDALHIGFQLRPLAEREPAIDELAVIVGGGGDIERAFLASL